MSKKQKQYVMIDIDKMDSVPETTKIVRIARMCLPHCHFGKIHLVRSPGGQGWHMWFQVWSRGWINPRYILLAQCLGGSDIKRERAGLYRFLQHDRHWNILFATRRVEF